MSAAWTAVWDVVAASGVVRVDPPTLVPASLVLELSGEAVRPRLCMFPGPGGEDLCLRPDMTASIADLVAQGRIPAGRLGYCGPVWRLPVQGVEESVEFLQVGFEWFDGGEAAEADARACALALEALAAGGVTEATLRFGDVALYRAVVDALDFPPAWRDRLKRAAGRRKGPLEVLDEARPQAARTSHLARVLSTLPPDEAAGVMDEIFELAGVKVIGGRPLSDILERLAAGALALNAPPPEKAALALRAFLEISEPADGALKALSAFARRHHCDIGAALETFAARLDALKACAPPMLSGARYVGEAGRRFDYYDGFAFEVVPAGRTDRPVAAGGRYDGLIERLSAGARSARAVGVAIRCDRLPGSGGA